MSIEEYVPEIESSEWPWQSWEKVKEISEKYKESAKKAQAGIKKTQKDEKKAKKYDFLLAKFLVELILKKKYDKLLGFLFISLDKWYWTNFLLWILSLVYVPISNEIRKISKKEKISFSYKIKSETVEFDDNHIDIEIRTRINNWIEDMESILLIQSSELISKNMVELIDKDDSITIFIGEVFKFFFNELNINISKEKIENYSNFIIWELIKILKKNYS